MLAWASAQIHCQFHASDSRVALPAQGTKQDVQAESDTVLIPSRGETNSADLSTTDITTLNILDLSQKIINCYNISSHIHNKHTHCTIKNIYKQIQE